MDRRMKKRRIAIVTGADGGIGMEYCRALARRGYSLVMLSVTESPLHEASERISSEWGVVTWPVTMDLTLANAPELLVGWLDTTGLMDDVEVLVNNAGIFSFDYLTSTPPQRIDAFVDLHVRSVAHMCRLFGERFALKGRGYILNMSSMSCWMPMPGLALYASTKAFLRVFSRSLALELRDSGVRVMVAAPGGIATTLFGLPPKLMRLAVGLGVVARPDKFADRAVMRLLKGKQQYINGLINKVSIVTVGCAPTWVRMQVKRRLLDRGIRKP